MASYKEEFVSVIMLLFCLLNEDKKATLSAHPQQLRNTLRKTGSHMFRISAGSITGASHVRSGKGNQDAHHSVSIPNLTVAVVCDGCSDGNYSGVGAQIGCRFIVNSIVDLLSRTRISAHDSIAMGSFWERVRSDVLAQVRVLANSMGDSFSTVITEYFLFTVVGVVITNERTVFFSIGDGVIMVNGVLHQLGPFPRNAPPYMTYGLSSDNRGYAMAEIKFNFIVMDTEQITTLLIGTDGCLELINGSERTINGKTETVGSISQFWAPAMGTNSSLATRRLRIINQSAVDWENRRNMPGWLQDDVTLITIQREEGNV